MTPFKPRGFRKTSTTTATDGSPQATASQQPSSDSRHTIPKKEALIALMGPTGAGKSTFISQCVEEPINIGHGLQSCTDKITPYLFKRGDITVTLLDTPGFDDSTKSDTDVLDDLATWLKAAYLEKVRLDGIIFLHRITDVRMQGSAARNLSMFKELCGNEAAKNIILATTRWEQVNNDKVLEDLAKGREEELIRTPKYWGSMIRYGSRVKRHCNTRESALGLVDIFLVDKVNKPSPLAIQTQMVDEKRGLGTTDAGIELTDDLTKKRKALDSKLATAKKKLEAARAAQLDEIQALKEDITELETKIQELKADIKKLKDRRVEDEKMIFYRRWWRGLRGDGDADRKKLEKATQELEELNAKKAEMERNVQEKTAGQHSMSACYP